MSRYDEERHNSFDFGQVVLIDGHYGNQETSILKLLVLKDNLFLYS